MKKSLLFILTLLISTSLQANSSTHRDILKCELSKSTAKKIYDYNWDLNNAHQIFLTLRQKVWSVPSAEGMTPYYHIKLQSLDENGKTLSQNYFHRIGFNFHQGQYSISYSPYRDRSTTVRSFTLLASPEYSRIIPGARPQSETTPQESEMISCQFINEPVQASGVYLSQLDEQTQHEVFKTLYPKSKTNYENRVVGIPHFAQSEIQIIEQRVLEMMNNKKNLSKFLSQENMSFNGTLESETDLCGKLSWKRSYMIKDALGTQIGYALNFSCDKPIFTRSYPNRTWKYQYSLKLDQIFVSRNGKLSEFNLSNSKLDLKTHYR